MQVEVPKHTSHNQNKPPTPPDGPREIKLGKHLTLLDKTLAYYVSQRGRNCYWGRVLNGCSIVVDHSLGTAGIELSGLRRYNFLYDPAYFNNLTQANRRCTLVHEAAHITTLHVPRYMRLMKAAPNEAVRRAIMAVFNIAADLEVNDTYVRLEPEFKTTIEEKEFWHLPEYLNLPYGLSMESYIELLIKNLPAAVKQLKQIRDDMRDGKGPPTPGPGRHSRRNRSDGLDGDQTPEERAQQTSDSVQDAAEKHKDLVNELLGIHSKLVSDTHQKWLQEIKEMAEKDPAKLEQILPGLENHTGQIIKTAHDMTNKLRGTVPGGVSQTIAAIMTEPQVPWTELLRDWMMNNIGRSFTETVRSPNLSLINVDGIEPFPGQIYEPEVNVTWITDTSGSMCDSAFAKASAEMAGLIRQIKSVRVHHIQVDTVIQNETVHDNDDPDIVAQTRYGYGGTRLEAAFARAIGVDLGAWREGVERVDEVRPPDMLVVFTDGYIEDMHPVLAAYHSGCPTLWIITPTGTVPAAVENLGAPHFAIRATN